MDDLFDDYVDRQVIVATEVHGEALNAGTFGAASGAVALRAEGARMHLAAFIAAPPAAGLLN